MTKVGEVAVGGVSRRVGLRLSKEHCRIDNGGVTIMQFTYDVITRLDRF